MKLSFKKVVLITIPVLLIGASIYYYIEKSKKGTEDTGDGNWIYRRSLNVENNQDIPLSEEDVLLTINTKELIEQRKLQQNCADLRFVDDDNLTQLNYWIEGGCDTENTEVWVRIPLVPKNGKTVYMYYGNEIAEDTQESWKGNFIIQNINGCSGETKKEDIFDGKYAMGSKVFGNTGGASKHSHEIENTTSNCTQKVYLSTSGSSKEDSNILSKKISSTEISIPSVETYFCSTENGLLPENSITMIDSSFLPSGWTLEKDIIGKFTIGISDKELTKNTSHAHKGLNSDIIENGKDTINKVTSIEVSTSSNIPPYYTMKYITNEEIDFLKPGSIAMFSQLPPLGWTYYSSLEDRFVLGEDQNIGKTGGDTSHKHTITLKTETVKGSIESNEYVCTSQKISTTENSSLPEYVTVIFGKKKSSLKVSLNVESAVFEQEKEETITKKETKNDEKVIAQNPEVKENGQVLGVSAPSKPTLPLTDGRTNPTYILSSTPSFSAIYSDLDTDNATAYEIEVNANSSFSGYVYWDSGKVSTTIVDDARSSEYTYNGVALTNSKNTLYWRIRFWDIDDEVSEWSDPASFVDFFNHSQLKGLNLKGIKIN
jgi:hypothetical protein